MLPKVKCDFFTNTDRVVLILVCTVVYDTLQIDFYLLKINKIDIKQLRYTLTSCFSKYDSVIHKRHTKLLVVHVVVLMSL